MSNDRRCTPSAPVSFVGTRTTALLGVGLLCLAFASEARAAKLRDVRTLASADRLRPRLRPFPGRTAPPASSPLMASGSVFTSNDGSFQETYDTSPSSGCIRLEHQRGASSSRCRSGTTWRTPIGNVIRCTTAVTGGLEAAPEGRLSVEVTNYSPSNDEHHLHQRRELEYARPPCPRRAWSPATFRVNLLNSGSPHGRRRLLWRFCRSPPLGGCPTATMPTSSSRARLLSGR